MADYEGEGEELKIAVLKSEPQESQN